jgi:hypothetical protein
MKIDPAAEAIPDTKEVSIVSIIFSIGGFLGTMNEREKRV